MSDDATEQCDWCGSSGVMYIDAIQWRWCAACLKRFEDADQTEPDSEESPT